jgi:hypothetical protein
MPVSSNNLLRADEILSPIPFTNCLKGVTRSLPSSFTGSRCTDLDEAGTSAALASWTGALDDTIEVAGIDLSSRPARADVEARITAWRRRPACLGAVALEDSGVTIVTAVAGGRGTGGEPVERAGLGGGAGSTADGADGYGIVRVFKAGSATMDRMSTPAEANQADRTNRHVVGPIGIDRAEKSLEPGITLNPDTLS